MMFDFNKQLRSLREQQGISLNSMAKKLGISSGYLSNLEVGKTENITLSLLEKIPEALGIKACPMCGQSTFLNNKHTETHLRIERVYQAMLTKAEKDPEKLNSQLELLEFGLLGTTSSRDYH